MPKTETEHSPIKPNRRSRSFPPENIFFSATLVIFLFLLCKSKKHRTTSQVNVGSFRQRCWGCADPNSEAAMLVVPRRRRASPPPSKQQSLDRSSRPHGAWLPPAGGKPSALVVAALAHPGASPAAIVQVAAAAARASRAAWTATARKPCWLPAPQDTFAGFLFVLPWSLGSNLFWFSAETKRVFPIKGSAALKRALVHENILISQPSLDVLA